jgi:hypothetical protein
VGVSEQGAQIVVDIRDSVTAKHLDRGIDLTGLPPDSRPLTLAVAVGELLRASWAELVLKTAPLPAAPVPRAVEDAVALDIERSPRSAPAAVLGVAGAIEYSSGGALLYGEDLRAAMRLTPCLAAAVRLGQRGSSPAGSADGEVHTTAWLAGVGATLRVTPWQHGGIDALARFDVEQVSFVAVPRPGARGGAATGVTLVAGSGGEAWIGLGPSLRLTIDGLVTVPLWPLKAQDAGRDVTAVSGPGVAGGLGLDVLL